MEKGLNINLVAAIKTHFAMLREGRILLMEELPEEYKAWVVRWDGRIGVAVPYAGEEKVYMSFSKIELESTILNGEKVLFLFIRDQENSGYWQSMNFASVCENFVEPGENGSNRRTVTESIQEWCDKWKDLLGNANREKPAYTVLGELFIYRWLLQQGIKPEWTGRACNRLDFTTENGSWEVKSTIVHTDLQITISSQKQLLSMPGCPLNLMFCRLEENPQGESINDMVQALVELGVDRDSLEEDLTGLGLRKGVFDRNQRFALVELRRYPVDDRFPKLTDDSFVGGKLPDGIVKVDYVVDLANLEYETIEKM